MSAKAIDDVFEDLKINANHLKSESHLHDDKLLENFFSFSIAHTHTRLTSPTTHFLMRG